MPNLDRFLNAQQGKAGMPSFQKAYNEIQQGAKTSHWIWYIFPQLRQLGSSPTAKKYGIVDFKEACEYLQNRELFKSYYKIAQLVLEQLKTRSVTRLMGSSIDAQKLSSSLTLFREAAAFLAKQQNSKHDYEALVNCCNQILTKLEPCKSTLTLINRRLTISKKKTNTPASDYSNLSMALGRYIEVRNNEWSFHYNFLGIMSVLYWLHDAICGTDYFNNKSKAVKVSAATNLKQIIDNKDCDSTNLSNAEKIALKNDHLGTLLSNYGGLENILQSIKSRKKSEFAYPINDLSTPIPK